MRKKNNSLILGMILLIVVLGIGYAYLSTTVTINGSSHINNPSWDIHFENVQVSPGSIIADDPIIDTNKTTVSYEVTLVKPGDVYSFTINVVNSGSIDGMIESISSKMNGVEIEELPSYLDYSVTYLDGSEIKINQELKANTSETYKMNIEYKKDISQVDLPTSEQTLYLIFNVVYTQATDSAIPVKTMASDSWDTIINNIQNNTIPEYYKVGDMKAIELDTYGTHYLRIANMSIPDECSTTGFSQTACGFVLEFADIIVANPMNSTATNVGGWKNSSGRTFVNSTIYNSIPQNIRQAIINTTVVSGHGTKTGETNQTTTDKLYLLSPKEIWNYSATTVTAASKTRQLDYYSMIGTSTSNLSGSMKGYMSEGDPWWWLRDAYPNEVGFWIVSRSGYYNSNYNADNLGGISPAFRIG